MIVIRMQKQDGTTALLLTLTPKDIETLVSGGHYDTNLNNYIPELNGNFHLKFAYTPDPKWIDEQFRKGDMTPARFYDLVRESLTRPESDAKLLNEENPMDSH